VPKDIEILYTDNGYSPKIITVKKGQSVHFINQSKLPMWTASDPHPVHTDYHDFDS
jgi:plastocyanin